MASTPSRRFRYRERLFIQEYLKDLNAHRAAMRAGYAEAKSRNQGYRLMRRPAIRAAIDQEIDKRTRRVRADADRVLREFMRIAFADARRIAHWSKKEGVVLKESKDLSDDDAAAILEVSSTGKGEIHKAKLKLHDKKHALDALARHIGLFGREKPSGESPAEAAERLRELIRSRLAHLSRPEDEG